MTSTGNDTQTCRRREEERQGGRERHRVGRLKLRESNRMRNIRIHKKKTSRDWLELRNREETGKEIKKITHILTHDLLA